ncbi:MAG TPA: hypothetical protein VEA78_11865 [Acidimicrobiales bacterium]|nr:hypothetical protein [Acidimicrobiales bacterium]
MNLRFRHSSRIVRFMAFGIAGVALTATWAAGTATPTSSAGTVSSSGDAITGSTPASAGVNRFSSAISVGGLDALTLDFNGRWGAIPTTATMAELDLSGAAFGTGTYFAEVSLGNEPANFAALGVEFILAAASADGSAGTCADADIDHASADASATILWGDNTDNIALFEAIEGGTAADVYCIGVRAAPEQANGTTTGSVIRRADPAEGVGTDPEDDTVLPSFVIVVNEEGA